MGGNIPPHLSSRQRGRGEGGVNLPTALLIAHMPGHQEPAVTVETISTPPSPSLHRVGLRRGMKHPSPIFLCYLSLSPLSSICLSTPRLSSSLSLTPSLPGSRLAAAFHPVPLLHGHPGTNPSLPISLFWPLLVFLPPSSLLPLFSSPFFPFLSPLYMCVFPSVVGKEEDWA